MFYHLGNTLKLTKDRQGCIIVIDDDKERIFESYDVLKSYIDDILNTAPINQEIATVYDIQDISFDYRATEFFNNEENKVGITNVCPTMLRDMAHACLSPSDEKIISDMGSIEITKPMIEAHDEFVSYAVRAWLGFPIDERVSNKDRSYKDFDEVNRLDTKELKTQDFYEFLKIILKDFISLSNEIKYEFDMAG